MYAWVWFWFYYVISKMKTNIEKLIGFYWKYKENNKSQYSEKYRNIWQYVFPVSWHS